jgi:hypothetical protein
VTIAIWLVVPCAQNEALPSVWLSAPTRRWRLALSNRRAAASGSSTSTAAIAALRTS